MEWLNQVEEARYYVDEVLKNTVNIDEIGNILDVEGEKDNLECDEDGVDEDPIYQHLDLGDHSEHDFVSSSYWCKKIDLMENDILCKITRGLDKNQRKVLILH